MVDPLAEVVTLLQPGARFSKLVLGASPWRIRRADGGQPFYGVILEGGCHIAIDGHAAIELVAGDFVLIPAARVIRDVQSRTAAAPRRDGTAGRAGQRRIPHRSRRRRRSTCA